MEQSQFILRLRTVAAENLLLEIPSIAICDRIVYDSYVIRIEGDTMRKRKGIMD